MNKHHRLNANSSHKCVLTSIVLTALITIGLVSWRADLFAQARSESHLSTVSLPPMTLTIINSLSSRRVLNETDIGNLTPYTSFGGRINQVGTISGVGNYIGIPINTLCDLVGGLHVNQTLRVTAVDGYNTTFTYDQINGDFVTYANTTPSYPVPHNQSLTTILAYYFNDVNLTSGGPLRFAIVGPEGLCTNSTYWVQKVVMLEILGTSSVGGYMVPLDPLGLLAPWIGLASMVTVAAVAIVYVKWKKKQRS